MLDYTLLSKRDEYSTPCFNLLPELGIILVLKLTTADFIIYCTS